MATKTSSLSTPSAPTYEDILNKISELNGLLREKD